MHQVLFTIPLKIAWFPNGIPIYGFGTMLFLAFVVCTWMIGRWAARAELSRDRLQDLAIWVFVCGIIGARIVYMIQYNQPIGDFYKIWEGGIVFYGSAIGGWVGFLLGKWWYRKEPISTWKIADMIAPLVCLGLAIGRIGCFLNGCCFGHICTVPNQGVMFPIMTSPAQSLVVNQGYQTKVGFAMDERLHDWMLKENPPALVGAVEPGSPAALAGLQAGDKIINVNGQAIDNFLALERVFMPEWPRGSTDVELIVERNGSTVSLPKFTPRTLPLYPTQLFESFSMILLFFVLITFYPYRAYYGQVFVLLMIGYAVHRFFNETLRNDTEPVLALKKFGVYLTLSQVGSIFVLAAAVVLHFFLRKFSPLAAPRQEIAAPAQVPVAVSR